MKYKGYSGVVELNEDSNGFFGRVVGLRDVITFQGTSIAEITQAFHDSVDDYLAFCAERGESPEKPYSGQFVLRVDPSLHRELAHAAEARNTSLNALVESTLKSIYSTSAEAEVTEHFGMRQKFRAAAYKRPPADRMKPVFGQTAKAADPKRRVAASAAAIRRKKK